MSRGTGTRSLAALSRRFGAFITERYPFALEIALDAFDKAQPRAFAAAGGYGADAESDIEALRKAFAPELRRRAGKATPDDFGETTPGVDAKQRFASALDELVDACD